MQSNNQTPTQMNGVSEESISNILMEDLTVGYRPQVPLEAMWQTGADMPQITIRRDIEFMRIHPIVSTALSYYRAGISGAEFWGGPDEANPDNEKGKPISLNPRVAQFVLNHCERFWQFGVPLLQEDGYPYGWCPGQHMYKEVQGMLVWSHLNTFHPSDGHILTCDYEPVGVRIKNIRTKSSVDIHLASESIPAKAAWYAHRPRAGNLYGRSQFIGAWLPWRMLGWRDGMDQVINAAVYRAGYCGPIIRYPPDSSAPAARGNIPGTTQDGGGLYRRENREVARQYCEWAKAGASFGLSSERWAESNELKWDLQWPEHVMDVRPLVDAAKWAEERIMLGMDVPPELIRAAETGSGYSGRSIPREAFLDGQQRLADAFLKNFVEQVVKPLVLWNFGDVPFSIQCKSLLKTQSDDKMGVDGQGQQQGKGNPPDKNAPPVRKQDESQPTTPAGQGSPAMSMNAQRDMRERVVAIAERVMRRMKM